MSAIPRGGIAAYSNGLECPFCHARLEIGPASRMLASWAGMAAGYLLWRMTRGGDGILGAVLPLLWAVLAFGAVSALAVVFSGDLRRAAEPPPVEMAPVSGHGHDDHGHSAHSGGHH
jgi:hypothetical protein